MTEETAEYLKQTMDAQPYMFIDKSVPPTTNQLNPFDLPLIPEGSRIALHLETKDITKGGIHLTDNAKKEIAAAESANNSKLYFITAVSESVYSSSKFRPGMWVLLSADAMGHSCKVAGKEMLLVEAYAIAGIVASHEDEDVTSQYTSFEPR